MMIKVFTMDEKGKISLTADELKSLLDEAYWEGWRNHVTTYTYNTPNVVPFTSPIFTCSNMNDVSKNQITISSNGCNIGDASL